MKSQYPKDQDDYLAILYDENRDLVESLNLGQFELKEEAIKRARNILSDFIDRGHEAGLLDLYGRSFTLSIFKNPDDDDLHEMNRSQSQFDG